MSMHDYADMEICILRLAFLPVTKAHVQIYFIFAKNIVWLEHVFDFLAIENLPYSFVCIWRRQFTVLSLSWKTCCAWSFSHNISLN